MSVVSAHAKSINELQKYDFIYSLSYFSIAENEVENKTLVLQAFKHNHDEYEFIIPLTTIPLLYYSKANYIGEVGFIYPVNPYVDHGLEVDLHSRVISITISQEYVEKIKEQLGYKGHYFYTRFMYKSAFLDLIKAYEEEYRNNPNSKKLDKIAFSITTNLIKLGLESGEDNRRPEKKYAKHMKQILLYIEDNYKDPDFNVAKIAEYSGYSFAYFTKAFKKYMHDTPIMHLNKRRISDAKSLLKNKDLQLSDIAKMVGYKNLSTFTEAFKRSMGLLPSEYRNKYIKG
ncbi:MAG: helix-turn-helix transcriptional regulator [Bacilli bacterium]|nr:helix-turn-helix transcriptional regulator [Bacilli bacterium]